MIGEVLAFEYQPHEDGSDWLGRRESRRVRKESPHPGLFRPTHDDKNHAAHESLCADAQNQLSPLHRFRRLYPQTDHFLLGARHTGFGGFDQGWNCLIV